jgi:hypothetical protein
MSLDKRESELQTINDRILKAQKSGNLSQEIASMKEKFFLLGYMTKDEYALLNQLIKKFTLYSKEYAQLDDLVLELYELDQVRPSLLKHLLNRQVDILSEMGLKMGHPRIQQLKCEHLYLSKMKTGRNPNMKV